MKRVLVTFVLALTTAAWGQGSTPSQQPPAQPAGQPPAAGGDQANTPTSQKVIKDPAEYNAYTKWCRHPVARCDSSAGSSDAHG